jgi:hypothetical protein
VTNAKTDPVLRDTWVSWQGMKQRCLYATHHSYHRYGGRGIRLHEPWKSFHQFVADMGIRPVGHSLERIDNDGPYAPGNCRWATKREQDNNRRNTCWITFDGRTMTLPYWADELGLSVSTVRNRFRKGWPLERVLSPQLERQYTDARKRREPTKRIRYDIIHEFAAAHRVPYNELATMVRRAAGVREQLAKEGDSMVPSPSAQPAEPKERPKDNIFLGWNAFKQAWRDSQEQPKESK